MQAVVLCFSPNTGWHQPLPLWDSPQTLVLIFCPPDFTAYDDAIKQLSENYPQAVFAGCSSAASIAQDTIHESALVVGIIQFKHTRLKMVSALQPQPSASWQAGQQLADQLAATDLRAVVVLTDGINTNGATLLQGLVDRLGNTIPIGGGLASGQGRLTSTWLLQDFAPTTHLACAIGFYGNKLMVASSVRDGWKLFGLKREITRAQTNRLYEIDHRPALEVYKQYLGDRYESKVDFTLHYPVAIWQNASKHYVVRTVFDLDEETQSLGFATDIPMHSQIQFMYGSTDTLVEGAESAAHDILEQFGHPTQPILSLAFSCVGRKLVMQANTTHELDSMLDELPLGSYQLGFYSYGELGTTGAEATYNLHNETMTLMALYERD